MKIHLNIGTINVFLPKEKRKKEKKLGKLTLSCNSGPIIKLELLIKYTSVLTQQTDDLLP
jgi:hypothetical protein